LWYSSLVRALGALTLGVRALGVRALGVRALGVPGLGEAEPGEGRACRCETSYRSKGELDVDVVWGRRADRLRRGASNVRCGRAGGSW
jgi:hypothetical protein